MKKKLDNEIEETLAIRGSRYGEFKDNSSTTQELCRVIQKTPSYGKLTDVHKEAFHMIFHKIARCCCGDVNYVDNIHDIIGYAKLLEDELKKQRD